MLVDHECRWMFEDALPEGGTFRRIVSEARAERGVPAARQHVDRVGVDEAALVIAYVDDHGLAAAILHVDTRLRATYHSAGS